MNPTTRRHALAALAAMPLGLCAAQAHAVEPFDEIKVLIEINATDGDAGFHTLFDAPAWKQVKMYDPEGDKVFHASPHDGLRAQGVTETFFESAEPVCDPDDAEDDEPVVSLAEFLARFPAGDYRFTGHTLEGDMLLANGLDPEVGSTELTYDLPAAPDIELTEDATMAFNPLNPAATPVLILWEPGDDLGDKCDDPALVEAGIIADPAEVGVVGWEVVLEPADGDDLDPARTLAVQLRGDQQAVTVAPEFLASLWDDLAEDGVLWMKFEVGAIEASGNQTFSEGEFCLYESAAEDCESDDEED